ncbi:hypothetical protein FNF27_05100 [Cafeteria roenbergensis]|uniref:EF-hand domain-containing protein n=1 Tax=Cafeteria roenbergensis TaxID=33653 RepID=A0A5A8DCP4_CAFRO|nr:hypothetical protein FNF29_04859 [Cafeteria roenbergensis]KAA0153722.1 hypothetical protein FNF31_06425 [Cafeteria roenbergensis]KAA0163273.1 hypothetical protein FNF28_04331 [Cafeteria roenbergensis]KAA0173460.1 hypothetical protein FNF27_05100 [Cafeteria roenbergensis]|eukprot:KAA0150969.1 hypothetical protein FNF29_04859 [Cafeteria roenbergensis]
MASAARSPASGAHGAAARASPRKGLPASPCFGPAPPTEGKEVQQLRGVFAAFDAGQTGALSVAELSAALLALGAEPTAAAVEKFRAASGRDDGVDVDAFLRVCAESFAGTGLRSTAPAVRELLEAFGDVSAAAAESGAAAGDPSTPAGAISLGTLRHLLCEVLTPSSLSLQEATDLFRMTGLMPGGLSGPQAAEHLQRLPVDARDARRRAAEDGGAKPQLTTVDAEELISLLCYASPTGAPASKPAAAV